MGGIFCGCGEGRRGRFVRDKKGDKGGAEVFGFRDSPFERFGPFNPKLQTEIVQWQNCINSKGKWKN